MEILLSATESTTHSNSFSSSFYSSSSSSSSSTPGCFARHEDDITIVGVCLGAFLFFGTFISYSPQYLRIIRAKNSIGISIWMLLLQNVANYSTFLNALLLGFTRVHCCSYIGWLPCAELNLAIIQLSAPPICNFILTVIFLFYYRPFSIPEDDEDDDEEEHLELPKEASSIGGINKADNKTKFFSDDMIGAVGFILFLTIQVCGGTGVGFTLLFSDGYHSEQVEIYATAWGYVAAVCIVLQWSPQIFKVYKLKGEGALSLAMLCIQMPGQLLVVFFQGVLYKNAVSTWLPFLAAALQMCVLIGMILFYRIKQRRKINKAVLASSASFEKLPVEESPLVGSSRSHEYGR